jgi:hypothetical protein
MDPPGSESRKRDGSGQLGRTETRFHLLLEVSSVNLLVMLDAGDDRNVDPGDRRRNTDEEQGTGPV